VNTPVEDLSPFFADRCWMFVLLARQSRVGVVMRRGPSEWWRITRWDTERDAFEGGQWFRGRMYPDKCDVSPDGKLFAYFAGKHRTQDISTTWTAVSRPPYLTALALWPVGDTYSSSGVFLDNQTLLVGAIGEHDPEHPPGPLRLVADRRQRPARCWESGWEGILAPGATSRYGEFRKPCGDLILGREVPADYFRPSRRRTLYTLYRRNGESIALFEAHWADWDQSGRLVATAGGRVVEGKLARNGKLLWKQLASMNEERPQRMQAPEWAQRWLSGTDKRRFRKIVKEAKA
jgi:hypothetical protein